MFSLDGGGLATDILSNDTHPPNLPVKHPADGVRQGIIPASAVPRV